MREPGAGFLKRGGLLSQQARGHRTAGKGAIARDAAFALSGDKSVMNFALVRALTAAIT